MRCGEAATSYLFRGAEQRFRLHKTLEADLENPYREQGDFISEAFSPGKAADLVSGLFAFRRVHMKGLPPVTATVVPEV